MCTCDFGSDLSSNTDIATGQHSWKLLAVLYNLHRNSLVIASPPRQAPGFSKFLVLVVLPVLESRGPVVQSICRKIWPHGSPFVNCWLSFTFSTIKILFSHTTPPRKSYRFIQILSSKGVPSLSCCVPAILFPVCCQIWPHSSHLDSCPLGYFLRHSNIVQTVERNCFMYLKCVCARARACARACVCSSWCRGLVCNLRLWHFLVILYCFLIDNSVKHLSYILPFNGWYLTLQSHSSTPYTLQDPSTNSITTEVYSFFVVNVVDEFLKVLVKCIWAISELFRNVEISIELMLVIRINKHFVFNCKTSTFLAGKRSQTQWLEPFQHFFPA